MLELTLVMVHAFAAMVTTGHALLSKTDARAATAWLVIVWLIPLLGSLAYVAFGINRIARKAIRLRKANQQDADYPFSVDAAVSSSAECDTQNEISKVGDELTSNQILTGNDLEILENGDEAYPSMIEEIEQARETIALSSYIFRLDEVGEAFVKTLGNAADRGVEVKVLIDGFGGGILSSPVIRKLKKRNIDARLFQFSIAPWNIPYLNLRNHKKLLIVDCKTGFVGGMNLGSENLLRKTSRDQVRDMHFRFTGPVVGQMLHSFIADWFFVSGEELDPGLWNPPTVGSGQTKARVINSGPDHELGKIETLFAAAINSAKHEISIVTPYFLTDTKITFLLQLAAIRGVNVTVIVPEKTDFSIFDWAFENHCRFLKNDRIEIFRNPSPFDHAKLLLVDANWCAIGSPNWDVRSMRLNFEILVECHDRETVGRLADIINRKKLRSNIHKPIEKSWSTLPHRIRNAFFWLLQPYL